MVCFSKIHRLQNPVVGQKGAAFPKIHRLQTPLVGEKGTALPKIFHMISYLIPSLLSFQIYAESVVPFLDWYLKSDLWFDQRALKEGTGRPTYFSVMPSSNLTVA